MKVRIIVLPKKGICDPPSTTVLRALQTALGFEDFSGLIIGRYYEIEAGSEVAEEFLKMLPGKAADAGIANFNTEQFRVEVVE